MKSIKYGVVLASLLASHAASASIWGKVKNAFNDCKYSKEEYNEVYRSEMQITQKLPDHFFGRFSESDFDSKPWMRDFIYVIVIDRAAKGAGAQSMRVYENGRLIHKAKVSTGRETLELKRKNKSCTGAPPKSYWSNTPTGYFTPKYLSKDHVSSSWDSSMPYAIFYDIDNGLALHEVYSKYAGYLGSRASGGCTRQDATSAQNLFNQVRSTEGRQIPLIREDGTPVLDESGRVIYITKQNFRSKTNPNYATTFNTYSALIIVEDSSLAK